MTRRTQHGEFRRRSARRNIFAFFGILLCVNLYLSVSTFLSLRLQDVESVSDGQNILPATWLSERTRLFPVRWNNHKLRNLVLYICISTRNLPVVKFGTRNLLKCPDVIYDIRYNDLFGIPSICVSHKCLKPFGRSHYVFAEFVVRTYEAVVSQTLRPPAPTPQGKIAVLVEPRDHPLIEYTVKQVMSTLGPSWSLQLFVSTQNEETVRNTFQIREGGQGKNIVLSRLNDFGLDSMGHMGNRAQSAFSAHRVMYEAIKSEHILWFQTDVLLRNPPRNSWLEYAYIGSEWEGCQFPTCSPSTCKGICSGGNSGLSLRRKSLLFRVATTGILPRDLWGPSMNMTTRQHITDESAYFESDDIHDNTSDRWFEDDLQLSYKLSQFDLLPPGNIPPRFAISQALPAEGLHRTNPAGMHKPWETPWFSPEIVAGLLDEPWHHIRHKARLEAVKSIY